MVCCCNGSDFVKPVCVSKDVTYVMSSCLVIGYYLWVKEVVLETSGRQCDCASEHVDDSVKHP